MRGERKFQSPGERDGLQIRVPQFPQNGEPSVNFVPQFLQNPRIGATKGCCGGTAKPGGVKPTTPAYIIAPCSGNLGLGPYWLAPGTLSWHRNTI